MIKKYSFVYSFVALFRFVSGCFHCTELDKWQSFEEKKGFSGDVCASCVATDNFYYKKASEKVIRTI